jgi:hydrogenase maturation protease
VTEVLVIGYGNELRRDDGAGPRVARAVAERGRPGIRAVAVHQLTPELAEPLAAADLAVFVDATTEGENVSALPLVAKGAGTPTHVCDPAWLLELTEAAYGRRPRAWLVTVPAADVGFGEGLSPAAACGVREALALVERIAEGG